MFCENVDLVIDPLYEKIHPTQIMELGNIYQVEAPVYTETCMSPGTYTFEFDIIGGANDPTDWISYGEVTNMFSFEAR